MQRVLITGSSGYLGQAIVAYLRSLPEPPVLIGTDLEPPSRHHCDEFHSVDIRSPDLARIVETCRADVVIHLAFVLNPLHSHKKMKSINVEGTENLLSALANHPPNQLLVLSSATAFGAWPERIEPADDLEPCRPRREFPYSEHKATVEVLSQQFAEAHPDCNVSWVRPTTIVGPNCENFVTRLLAGSPMLLQLDRLKATYQFVHEEDVARAITTILQHRASGPFNIAPPDKMTMKEIAVMLNKPCWRLPFRFAQSVIGLAWISGLPAVEIPPGFLWFARYPWMIKSRRLVEELSFEFRYDSRQALDLLFRRIRGIRSGVRLLDYKKIADARDAQQDSAK